MSLNWITFICSWLFVWGIFVVPTLIGLYLFGAIGIIIGWTIGGIILMMTLDKLNKFIREGYTNQQNAPIA